MRESRKMRLWPLLPLALILAWWLWPRIPPGELPASPSPPVPERPATQAAAVPAAVVTSRPSASPVPSPARGETLGPKEVAAARTEMKLSLSALYTAEKAFHAEYGRYSTDLLSLGYWPEEKERWSQVGFLRPASPADPLDTEESRRLDLTELFAAEGIPLPRPALRATAPAGLLSAAARHCQQGCTATSEQFEIAAVAQLVDGAPPDVWVINERKELRHAQDGAPAR